MLTIAKHTTQLDIAAQQFGTLQVLFDAALLNSKSITDDLIAGNSWKLPLKVYEIQSVELPTTPAQSEQAVVKKHQEITDFTTQHAGSLSSLFEVALLNGMSITDNVNAGSVLKVNASDLKVIKYYKTRLLDIVNTPKANTIQPGGIGYMQIGNDFKVS